MIKRFINWIYEHRKFYSLMLAFYLIPLEFRSVIFDFGFYYLWIRVALFVICNMYREWSELWEV